MANQQLLSFFSYAREDSPFALKLASDLKQSGVPVWLDQLDIAPGERWDRSVEVAIAECPSMLVLLSPAATASQNVMDEVSYALEERKIIIPVLYRECRIPFRLRRLQYADFRSDYEAGLTVLNRTLARTQHPTPVLGFAANGPTYTQVSLDNSSELDLQARRAPDPVSIQSDVTAIPADPGKQTHEDEERPWEPSGIRRSESANNVAALSRPQLQPLAYLKASFQRLSVLRAHTSAVSLFAGRASIARVIK